MRRMAFIAAALLPVSAFGADLTATAYQVKPSHNAAVYFAAPWGPKLKPVWTATLDGPASFPLVADHSVYALVSGTPGEIDRIDAATGHVVWKVSTGSGTSNGLAYDDGRLFSVNGSGTMSAYAAGSGKLLWAVQLPGQYSFSAAPSALNGIVYTGGAGSGGTLYAVDESSGNLLWSQPVANGDSSSPAVTNTGVYVSYPCQYYDFAPTTGQLIWQYNGGCEGGGGDTPVVAGNYAFIRDFTGSNSILNAATGAVLGTFPGSNPPAIAEGNGYYLDGQTLVAINTRNAHIGWEFTGDGSIDTPPLVVNDTVIAASAQGNFYVLDRKTGAVAWTTQLSQGVQSPLGAGAGLILIPAGNTLIAYGSAK